MAPPLSCHPFHPPGGHIGGLRLEESRDSGLLELEYWEMFGAPSRAEFGLADPLPEISHTAGSRVLTT